MKISISRNLLILFTILWVCIWDNLAVWQAFYQSPSAGSGVMRLLFVTGGGFFLVSVISLFFVIFSHFFIGRSIKIFCILVLIISSILGFYTFFYGVRFNDEMLTNMLLTDGRETKELITWRIIIWFTITGILPSILVLWVKLIQKPIWQRLTFPTLYFIGFFACALALIMIQYAGYASTVRNGFVAFNIVAPVNIVGAGLKKLKIYNSNIEKKQIGLDAQTKYPLAKPRLVVFVLGETARAQNHGLNGYSRETTPMMRENGGVYFPDTISCGTSTATSLPCIFSGVGRSKTNLMIAYSQESLIDVLKRAHNRVIWRDNDMGCKDVCNEAEFEDFNEDKNPEFCDNAGNCWDEVMLKGLRNKLLEQNRDTFLVLHIKGSHGPAYYKRYPKQFAKFQPECLTNDLAACTVEQIVNSYDNSILYTDFIVGKTIEILKDLESQFAPMLIYVSDHGESLGENGLFLHGIPYAFAPDTQTRVPLYAWFSDSYLNLENTDKACVSKQNKIQRSHDDLFSTFLGALKIKTQIYQPEKDIFQECDRRK